MSKLRYKFIAVTVSETGVILGDGFIEGLIPTIPVPFISYAVGKPEGKVRGKDDIMSDLSIVSKSVGVNFLGVKGLWQ